MAIRFSIVIAFILNSAGIRIFNYRKGMRCASVTNIPAKIFSISMVILLHSLLYNNKLNLVLRRKINRYLYAVLAGVVSLMAIEAGMQMVWMPLEDWASQVHDVWRLLRHLGYRTTSRCLRGCLWRDGPRCTSLFLHVFSTASLLLSVCMRRFFEGRWFSVLEDDEGSSLFRDVKSWIFGGKDVPNLMTSLSQLPQKVKLLFSRRQ